MRLSSLAARLAALLIGAFAPPARADLVLAEATTPQRWRGREAQFGKPLFISAGSDTSLALPIKLRLQPGRVSAARLALDHTDWMAYKMLRIRAFAEQPFETPLSVALEDRDGRAAALANLLPFGAPGWNEFDLNIGTAPVDRSKLAALCIASPLPLAHPAPSTVSFYLAEMRLLANAQAQQAAFVPSTPPALPPVLRISLGSIFPQHLIVERFRVAVGTNTIARLALPLNDETMFDMAACSNLVAAVESQAAAFRSQTNVLGLSFVISAPELTTSSPLKLRAFHRWLASTYHTVGDLNGRWDSRLARFEDAVWPRDAQTAPWRDAVSFWQEAVARTLRECVQAARRGAPRAYLLPHLDRLTGEAWRERPLDYYAIQRTAGWSHYSLADGGGDSREFLSGAETRALISTLAAQIHRRLWADSFDWGAPEKQWLAGHSERWLAPVASRNLWLQLAAGKDGVSVPREVPQLAAPLQQIAPLWPVFAATRSASPRLGVVCSSCSRLMNGSVAETEERRFFESFWRDGWQPVVIFEETFRDYPKVMGDYNVLALGGATHLPNWLQDALLAWVEGGGTLLCSGPPGLYDPWGRRLARLMWETLGLDDARLEKQNATWRWRVDASRLKPHCVLMATDEANEPLVIRAQHGRGEVVVSLVPFFEVKQARDYWPWKLRERVRREIESPERNLHLDWRTCDDRRTFFSVAINLSPYAPVKTQVIANDSFSRVLNLSADGGARPLPLEKADYSTSFPIELPPGGGAVLMLERASARR
ncbi:MAG: hypothetical protein N2689_05270 [Verrucomicrobiae bacterium]|nr:hypothetical protein [Verrucomicrobiae bacterium]